MGNLFSCCHGQFIYTGHFQVLALVVLSQIVDLKAYYEIVSLVGTLSDSGHLHVSLSDKDGGVIGGHVMGDMIVFTTAEVMIGVCPDMHFERKMDERTGFPELTIRSKE